MSVIAFEAQPHQSMWNRVALQLRSWGRTIRNAAVWVGDTIVRGAKWLYHTKAVQWVATKSQLALTAVWNVAKGPVGWVVAPVAAIIFAPKAVAVMLFLVLLTSAVVGYLGYKTYRHLQTVSTPEELQAMAASINETIREANQDLTEELRSGDLGSLIDDEPLLSTQTLEDRFGFLKLQADAAHMARDADKYSEVLARMNLIEVRDGQIPEVRPDASVSAIHRYAKNKVMDMDPKFPWNKALMYQAARAEDKRVKDLARLKAEATALTSV